MAVHPHFKHIPKPGEIWFVNDGGTGHWLLCKERADGWLAKCLSTGQGFDEFTMPDPQTVDSIKAVPCTLGDPFYNGDQHRGLMAHEWKLHTPLVIKVICPSCSKMRAIPNNDYICESCRGR